MLTCRRKTLLRSLLALTMVMSSAMTTLPTPATAGSPTNRSVAWRPTDAPENGDVAGAQWLEIDVPVSAIQQHRILAAVFRPAGDGPFPAVVYL
ncbi:MAG TPA: hypothetical protein VFH48_34035, partial [Chloroflexota bacterium]|nr:hypothetical protein [Chloroflexota bacterium]